MASGQSVSGVKSGTGYAHTDPKDALVGSASGSNALRRLGIIGIIRREEHLTDAIKYPDKFTENRTAAITDLAKKVESVYTNTFTALVNEGVDDKTAENLATNQAKATYSAGIAIINMQFPGDLVSDAFKDIGQSSSLSKLTRARRASKK
jgi:hypothetical protein